MNQETAEQIAKKAAAEAVKEFIEQSRKLNRRKNFRNTKRLMENYNAIKACVEEGVSEVKEIEVELMEEWDEDMLFVASIRRSKFRSAIMLAQIDKCLELLRRQQESTNDMDKYNVFLNIYLEGKSYEEVSEEYNCSGITARRWTNNMLDSLSSFLFGIDGIYME